MTELRPVDPTEAEDISASAGWRDPRYVPKERGRARAAFGLAEIGDVLVGQETWDKTVHVSAGLPGGMVGFAVRAVDGAACSAWGRGFGPDRIAMVAPDVDGVIGVGAPILSGLRREDRDVVGACLPTWSNPRLDRAELLKMRERMTETRFRQEICGELVSMSGKVFDADSVEACATGESMDSEPGAVYVAGLDVASSHDYTVLTVARRAPEGACDVVHLSRFTRLPFSDQIDRVRRVLDRYHHAPVKVDATGLGEPVVQAMREAGLNVTGVVLTAKSKTAIVKNAQVLFERGRIVIPRREFYPELHDELLAYEYLDADGGDHRKMGAPSGTHDDCVISLALCASYFYAGGGKGRAHRFVTGHPATTPTLGREGDAPLSSARDVYYVDGPEITVGGFKSKSGDRSRSSRVYTPGAGPRCPRFGHLGLRGE